MTLPVRKLPAASGEPASRERAGMLPAARVRAGAGSACRRPGRPLISSLAEAHPHAAIRLGPAPGSDDLDGGQLLVLGIKVAASTVWEILHEYRHAA